MTIFKTILVSCIIFTSTFIFAQEPTTVYKKRVLESTEVDFLTSFYIQDGDNASVCGGIGTENLKNVTSTFVVSIPLNDDDILTIDAGVSAYSSASSSNINPFGKQTADPFIANSGASGSDALKSGTISYSHSSDSRNEIWSAKISVSSEYDYFSTGIGGSYTKLFNEKNTELSVHWNLYIDQWKTIYPSELKPFAIDGDGLNNSLFINNTVTGNLDYSPLFNEFDSKGRYSYSLGFGSSQILSKKLHGSIALDFVLQNGLLSTPFHRIYFSDIEDSFIDNFQLADNVEHLPNVKFKIASGSRLNYYINERLVIRTFYRYYFDDWGVNSHTASIELPIKITDKLTLYPSYRFYNQTQADYFAPYEQHISTNEFYTSDYDLSEFMSNQFSLGLAYTDIFTEKHIWKFGLKSIDIKFNQYNRDSNFRASFVTAGGKFILD